MAVPAELPSSLPPLRLTNRFKTMSWALQTRADGSEFWAISRCLAAAKLYRCYGGWNGIRVVCCLRPISAGKQLRRDVQEARRGLADRAAAAGDTRRAAGVAADGQVQHLVLRACRLSRRAPLATAPVRCCPEIEAQLEPADPAGPRRALDSAVPPDSVLDRCYAEDVQVLLAGMCTCC